MFYPRGSTSLFFFKTTLKLATYARINYNDLHVDGPVIYKNSKNLFTNIKILHRAKKRLVIANLPIISSNGSLTNSEIKETSINRTCTWVSVPSLLQKVWGKGFGNHIGCQGVGRCHMGR